MKTIQKQPSDRKSQHGFIEDTQSCSRCEGLLVRSYCVSPDQGSWEFQIPVGRCLQCGDVVDGTILLNRLRAQLHHSIH